MSWKRTLGEIVGIVVGVTFGAGLVHVGISALRGNNPPPQIQEADLPLMPMQQNAGVFDQVAANVAPRR